MSGSCAHPSAQVGTRLCSSENARADLQCKAENRTQQFVTQKGHVEDLQPYTAIKEAATGDSVSEQTATRHLQTILAVSSSNVTFSHLPPWSPQAQHRSQQALQRPSVSELQHCFASREQHRPPWDLDSGGLGFQLPLALVEKAKV